MAFVLRACSYHLYALVFRARVPGLIEQLCKYIVVIHYMVVWPLESLPQNFRASFIRAHKLLWVLEMRKLLGLINLLGEIVSALFYLTTHHGVGCEAILRQ